MTDKAKMVMLEYIGPKRGGVVVVGKGGAIYAFLPAKKAKRAGERQPSPMQCAVPVDLAEELLARKGDGGKPVFRSVNDDDEAPQAAEEKPGRSKRRGDA